MNELTTEIIAALAQKQDLDEVFRHHLEIAINQLLKMPNLLTFMDFPPAIRQSLYSTNLIENFNKHLKRTTHHKEQFPTEDSLDRFLVSQFNVYNEKSLKRIHRGFKGLQDTLEASFI